MQGKHAVIGIANDPGSLDRGTLFEVTDDPDTFTFMTLFGAPATDCSSGVNNPSVPLASGYITIIDAPAVPATKDQCRNGGWRDFPGFKNQGDCVSYVATGGRNKPAGT